VGATAFAVALALRLWGIGFGLPELFHPDEPAYVLQALATARGLPNGLTFADPPLFKYVLLAEYGLTFGVDRADGATRSAQEFVEQFRADPSRLYALARGTSAVFGALTALAAAALGMTLARRRVGLLAGCLTAVTYLPVRESHFGVGDALVTLLVTVGLIFCARIATCAARREYVLAGALAGLAFAAKYDGIALLGPLLLARRPGRNLALAALACVVAALVAFPSLLIEPERVLNDIYVHDYLQAASGYDGLDPSGGYIFYARALGIGLGWPLLIASLMGLLHAVWTRNRAALVIASLPVAMLLVLGSQKLYFARFLLPATPALMVLAGLALDAVLTWRAVVGIAAIGIVTSPTLADSVRFDNLLTRTDTRILAREWITSQLPYDAGIGVDAPPLGPAIDRPNVLVANEFSLFDLTPADYASRSIDYLVVSSFTAEARVVDPARDQRRIGFNAALSNQATLVAEFRPYSRNIEPPFAYDEIYGPWTALDELSRPGPTISVYRLSR
jgi:glycosyl transferase family 87